jgi:hypothetical protein
MNLQSKLIGSNCSIDLSINHIPNSLSPVGLLTITGHTLPFNIGKEALCTKQGYLEKLIL